MIYSQWEPDGGYTYFETAERAPLGDDLPVPTVRPINDLGAPSVLAGRPIPPGARMAGSGQEALGLVAPMMRLSGSQLVRGYDGGTALSDLGWFMLGGAFTAGIYLAWRRWWS